MTDTQLLAYDFLAHATERLLENIPRIDKCLNLLSEAQVWQRPNPASNSIGNLILHLSGNIQQWIISSIGGKTDIRVRDAEFAATEGHTKAELLAIISDTIQNAVKTISTLNENDLLQLKSVQGYDYSALGNILHVVEHLSYHVGQIAYWTKVLEGQDLGFYADNDSLNKLVEK